MKILNKLTIRHLKLNKKRTIVTIIGVILSTALMVGIGLLFSTFRDIMIQDIIEQDGKHHVMIEVEKDKLSVISKNENISSYMYTSNLGFSLYEGIKNDFKPYIHLLGADKNYLENLKLLEGRLPNDDKEIIISKHLLTNGLLDLKVGDKITLNLGKRVTSDGYELIDSSLQFMESDFVVSETLKDLVKKEYTIVGICERDINEFYENPGYSVFTYSTGNSLKVYINYKKVKDTYKNTTAIAQNLGYKQLGEDIYEEVEYNNDLLSMSGVTKYNNITTTLSCVISIVLSLVSIACIIVIYNSFAISVMERKKQFGLFSSIGTTKKQLRHTVLFEAFIVGLIGIPLGILSGYLGIYIVLKIVNGLLSFAMTYGNFNLVTYPMFIIIPIIFMIITIVISAYLPARKASKVSPIEAIRQNDDIKISSKKVRSPKIISKLFGIEGLIAYKNMKRNKKKYRITIISLFISTVLFISFSSLIKYGIQGSIDFTDLPSYEYQIDIVPYESTAKYDDIITKVLSVDGIKKYSVSSMHSLKTNNLNVKYNNEAIEYKLNNSIENIYVYFLNKEAYDSYKKQIGVKEDKVFVLNNYERIEYKNNSRKKINIKLFDEVSNFDASYYDFETLKMYDESYSFNNIYLTDIYPMGIEVISEKALTVIAPNSMYEQITNSKYVDNNSKQIFLNANNYDEIDNILASIENNDISIHSYNIKEELQLVSNLVLVIKILLYGFISLVTLIGVTSVLNTINTSIALRRKEFAVLRSIGLTPKGFNKMLFFESLFFGFKSLLYSIPVSILITLLFHNSMNGIVKFKSLLIPWSSILIAIVGVFVIVIISMWYSSIRIKKENILDSIREENI